jgi:hypothetical protein
MPQIFTGKVVIPGEQLPQYLEAMAETEAAREPFRRHLEGLNEAFGAWLATKYSRKTVLKHTGVVDLFIDFLCDYTDLERLEDVTRGMVNSGFRSWVKRKVWGGPDADALRVGLRKFFRYLDAHQGIRAPTALAALT